jgi:hypothetical protein
MGVINQGREKTRWKNVHKTTQSTKMSIHKKRPNKKVTLTHAHK